MWLDLLRNKEKIYNWFVEVLSKMAKKMFEKVCKKVYKSSQNALWKKIRFICLESEILSKRVKKGEKEM